MPKQNLATNSKAPDAEVVIVGAGIGGLAAALAMAQRDVSCHILERRTTFEPEGAGIQLGPNGTRILGELSIQDALAPLAGVPEYIDARNAATGASLAHLPLGGWIEARHGAPYWVLHRQDLHQALLQAVQNNKNITITTGFSPTFVEPDEKGVTVADNNGKSIRGHALVAADGIRSQLRDDLFDGLPLAFAHKSAARAVIPANKVPAELGQNATTIWMSPRAHVVHYPVRGGQDLAMIFVRKDSIASDDWSTSVPRSWITDVAAEFAAPLKQLLSVPEQWKKWALFELPPVPRWNKGNIALLGDAAHPTLPFLAQGAVLALEDAAILGRRIRESRNDIRRALTAYAQARRHRASRVVAAAKSNGRIYHLDGPMAAARDTTLRVTPARLLMARYDWVYGWRPH
ncbi:MAG: FAD-dependent monooxygenase [Hyphomicrobiaceae bacterium]|nr:FAD-dependent monooxygenase [Hyphomicrobiaceae bacterium]MCC0010743.1 FAD-dependent monooxygenase [Hyphomicrobiaceae bacterium]